MSWRSRSAPLACAILVACSDSGPPETPDGGTSVDAAAGVDSGIAPPAEPARAALPSLACPDGWRSAVAVPGDPPTCHPYPADEPEACADGEAHFPGEPGCAVIGAPCPAGDFPEGLPSDRPIAYVRAGAPAGGAGTEASPFATIAEALAAFPSNAVIALSKGTHRGGVRLRTGTTLWGACAADTIVTEPAASDTLAVIAATDRGVVVKNVTITGPRLGVVVQSALGEVELDGVRIAGVATIGAMAYSGGRAVVRNTVVRDVATTSDRNAGIAALLGASIVLERVVVERAAQLGIAIAGSTADLVDVAVRDSLPRSDGTDGGGILAGSGSTVTGHRVIVERVRVDGFEARGTGTTATLADIVVRDVASEVAAGSAGRGLTVRDGAVVAIDRVWVTRARDIGVVVSDAGSDLRLVDGVVTDVETDESGTVGGRGIGVQLEARATIERVYVARCREYGLAAAGGGTTAQLSDFTVVETREIPDGRLGFGVTVARGARVELTRAELSRNRTFGLLCEDPATVVIASDLVVRDTRTQALDDKYGVGVQAQLGATLELTRGRIEASRSTGAVTGGARLVLTDVLIAGVEGDARGLAHGLKAITSTPTIPGGTPGEIAGARVVVSSARELAVSAWEGSTIRLDEVVVTGTRPAPCADVGVCDAGGTAVGTYRGGRVELRQFLLADSALCGVQLATGGEIDLHDGMVTRNVCGANVQTEGFDLARLMDGVAYVDNEISLDSSVLPLPAALPDDVVVMDAR